MFILLPLRAHPLSCFITLEKLGIDPLDMLCVFAVCSIVSCDASESHPGLVLYGSRLDRDSTFRGRDSPGVVAAISRTVWRRISGPFWRSLQASRFRFISALIRRQITQMIAIQIAPEATVIPAMASLLTPCDESLLPRKTRCVADLRMVILDALDSFRRKGEQVITMDTCTRIGLDMMRRRGRKRWPASH